MKGDAIVLGAWKGREAAALMRDGLLHDLLVADDAPAPGTVYRAIADRPMKGQGGLFLKTPDGPAYLRQIKGIKPGERLIVQVSGYAEPGKAIPVTNRVLFKSRYAIVTPGAPGLNISRQIRDEAERERLEELAHDGMGGSPMGLILRSACEGGNSDAIADDIAQMHDLAEAVVADTEGDAELLVEGDGPHALAWREWPTGAVLIEGDNAFEDAGVLDAIAEALSAEVSLGQAGSMWIEPTRALVAIDINTGGATSPAAGLKANIAAVRDIPRHLRIRGLGGQIVIDCAPMPKKDRRQLESALRAALKADSVETTIVGWTALGHLELHRKRERPRMEINPT